MKTLKSHMVQEALFLVFFIGLSCRVSCFLNPNSRPDESYLGFTYEAANFSPAIEYDYIIVGGGTAACPLAATLSEEYSVLVLERGGVASLDPNVLFESNSLGNIITANEQDSPAQPFTSEEGVPSARGRVLGGSSMINFGYYSRADDYFFEKTGIKWDMCGVEKAYQWVEDSIVTRPESLNTWQTSTYDALVESGVGPVNGFTVKHVQGTKVSGTTFDGSGRRHGAVELLNHANPANLRVVVRATVDRLIFSTLQSSGLTAVGVVYHDAKGRNHEVRVRRNGEVIVSAGAIGTPQLLLVSGVGPRSDLSSLDIPVLHHNPFVGQLMADNPRTQITLLVPFPLADIGSRVIGITENNGAYIESVSGVAPFLSPASFILFPTPSLPLNLSLVAIVGKVPRPLSTGSLSLTSPNNVTIGPKLRFNYFSHPEDLVQCGNVVQTMAKMLKTEAMELYKFQDRDGRRYFQFVGDSLPENETDVESFCRKTVTTYWHYHGGCLVKKVVDSDLKVMGISSLRVVDGSIFSSSPGTNPQATVMMLGRYMGMKIRHERGAIGVHSSECLVEDQTDTYFS